MLLYQCDKLRGIREMKSVVVRRSFSLGFSGIIVFVAILFCASIVLVWETASFYRFWGETQPPWGEWPIRVKFSYVFNLAVENVVASWMSSMLLLVIAIFALIGAVVDNRSASLRRGWFPVALIFAGLSLDEMASYHERVLAWKLGTVE